MTPTPKKEQTMPDIDSMRVGDPLPELRKGPITRQHLVEWCAAENDYLALHYDERVAQRMQLPGCPIQGTYRYALMGQMLQHWIGSGGVLRRLSASYRGLNLEGQTITAHGRISAIHPTADGASVMLDVWIENTEGKQSTMGQALVELRR